MVSRFIFSVLAAVTLFAAWNCAPRSLETGGDFSSFWLGAEWLRERPAETPLYYPMQDADRPNSRIWAMIRTPGGDTDALKPWYFFGRKCGVAQPKFYLYPPAFAAVFVPLTFFSEETAARIWALLNAGALIFSAVLIARIGNFRNAGMAACAVLAAAMAMWPTWWALRLGQNTLLLFALWTMFAIALSKRRDVSAGIALGLLAAVKLNPLALAAWLVFCGRWRAAVAACAVFGGSLLLGACFIGIHGMTAYFRELLPLLASGTHFSENQSLAALALRLNPAADPINAVPGVFDDPLPRWVAAVSLLLFAATLLPAVLRAMKVLRDRAAVASSENAPACELAALILVLQIISPVSWAHYLVVNVLVLVLLFQNASARRWWAIALSAAAFVLQAIPALPFDFLNASHGRLLMSHRLFGVAMLWLLAMFFALRPAFGNGNKVAA